MRALLVAGLIGLVGCSGAAERRLLILQEAQIVLQHSKTDVDFEQERATLELHLQEELSSE